MNKSSNHSRESPICQGTTSVVPQMPQIDYGFSRSGKNPHSCHPESPAGIRDLHFHLPLLLPFLQSEISNLKFEISDAFAVSSESPSKCLLEMFQLDSRWAGSNKR
jgi:hypothetical protein